MRIRELTAKVTRWNTEHGTRFSIGSAYGHWELWGHAFTGAPCGDLRLETGTAAECFRVFDRLKGSPRYAPQNPDHRGPVRLYRTEVEVGTGRPGYRWAVRYTIITPEGLEIAPPVTLKEGRKYAADRFLECVVCYSSLRQKGTT